MRREYVSSRTTTHRRMTIPGESWAHAGTGAEGARRGSHPRPNLSGPRYRDVTELWRGANRARVGGGSPTHGVTSGIARWEFSQVQGQRE